MSLLLVFTVSLLICLGQLLQKKAVENWRGKSVALARKLVSPWLLGAIVSLAAGMALWLVALQRLPVGIAYPMLSLNFVWITIGARVWFGEQTDARHWLGIGLIIAGISLLGSGL